MLALAIALVIMLVTVSGTLIAVLVAGNQSAQSKVHVKYTSSDVNVKVEAKYYVGTTGTDMIDKSNSNKTYVELNAIKSSGSLDQPVDEVNLSKENSKIIYEYKFTNVSDKIPATIGQLVENGSVVVPKDSNNNVQLTYTSSSTSLGAGASSDATTLNTQGLPAGTTRYVYVIVSIVELLNDVDFEGTFGWDLAKGEGTISTTNNTSATSGIIFDTAQTGLYNKSDVEQLQLVVGVENTEPEVYPMVANECFTGWYTDSALTSKAVFPLIPTLTMKLYAKHETATSGLQYTYTGDSYKIADGDTEGPAPSYTGSATDVYIPDVYDDGVNGLYPVTEIGDYAFYTSEVENVFISNSVVSIGGAAFGFCYGLINITIPSSVVSIGSAAFESCDNVISLTIPSGVTSIGDSAFSGCSGLTSITIGSGVTSIGSSAFSDCSKLTSITIGSGVTSIGNNAFFGCSKLTSITIPDSVTSIGSSAFDGCSGLTSITIGSGVTSIGDSAFRGCSSGLTSIAVDSGNSVYCSESNCLIQRSDNQLILGCKNSIIPSSVTSIGFYAFNGCTGLTSITIPNSVTSIWNSAFSGCSGLTSITIGSGVTSIGSFAFDHCSGLTSISIPNSVTSIGNSAFSYCSSLTNITIGSGVKKIGSNAFNSCSKLTSATFKTTTGWTVTTSSTATTGTAVTISTTDLAANATLLKTTHVKKYWNRA